MVLLTIILSVLVIFGLVCSTYYCLVIRAMRAQIALEKLDTESRKNSDSPGDPKSILERVEYWSTAPFGVVLRGLKIR